MVVETVLVVVVVVDGGRIVLRQDGGPNVAQVEVAHVARPVVLSQLQVLQPS
jgi:hypothetical protein